MQKGEHHTMTTVTALAKDRGCAESTVRKALIKRRINGSKHGPIWIVYEDQVLEAWKPRERPGRPPNEWVTPTGDRG